MRKEINSILTAVVLSLALCVTTGCSTDVDSSEDLHKATKNVTVEVVHEPWGTTKTYKGSKKNINITSDFTIMTTDEFFTYNFYDKNNNVGRVLEKMTLNGNGHTITIKGETNGSLGKYSSGLFGRIQNCEIKDLNIVYDLDLKINGSHGSKFGGLSADISGSTVTNCNVEYKRKTEIPFWTDSYGYHNSGFGGLVGYTGSTTYDNCYVSGELYGTAGYIGGIAAYTYSDVKIKNSVFSGGINTAYLEESFVGGLVGYNEGEIYSSKVELDYFRLIGQPQAWRNRTSSGGGLVGKLAGNLHDCYLDFKENGYYYAERIDDGAFSTVLNAGVLVGEAISGSKIKNVYADGYNDSINNVLNAEIPVFTSLGIRKNESTEVSNVYFIDDSYYYDYEESFVASKEIIDDTTYSFKGTIHGDEALVKVFLEYDEDDNEYDPDYIALTIGENVYELKTRGLLVPNSQLEYSDKVEEIRYIINISQNLDNTYTIKFNKSHGNLDTESSIFTSKYDDLKFDSGENIIGGESNFWKKDSTTNKPLLKGID